LESMLEKATAQLKLHEVETGTNDTWLSLFDHVVFCTNVTYADGHFKAGMFPPFPT
jgi:folylpolyglutamate synthase